MPIIREIMTADVFVTDPDATLTQVADEMLRRRFGSAVVSSGSMILGILTERDLLRAAAAGADVTSARVSEWMTADPITAEPTMDADEAIEVLMSHGFRHLPVLEGGALVGLVSLRDLVRTQIGRAATNRG
jgi:CBS domain-containing protein